MLHLAPSILALTAIAGIFFFGLGGEMSSWMNEAKKDLQKLDDDLAFAQRNQSACRPTSADYTQANRQLRVATVCYPIGITMFSLGAAVMLVSIFLIGMRL